MNTRHRTRTSTTNRSGDLPPLLTLELREKETCPQPMQRPYRIGQKKLKVVPTEAFIEVEQRGADKKRRTTSRHTTPPANSPSHGASGERLLHKKVVHMIGGGQRRSTNVAPRQPKQQGDGQELKRPLAKPIVFHQIFLGLRNAQIPGGVGF